MTDHGAKKRGRPTSLVSENGVRNDPEVDVLILRR